MTDNWRNRITGHGTEAPDQLLANPANWRVHPKAQQDALAGVLNEVGWVQDVIVNQRTGHLVDGHLRVSLALRQNEPMIPVVYVDLEPHEEALILATIDPLSALAATDKNKLDSLLHEVQTGEPAVQAMLAALAVSAGLKYGAPINDSDDPGADMDHAKELLEKWGCKVGDLWQAGRHRLLCGDSTNEADVLRVMGDDKADCVFTDPLYGVQYQGKGGDSIAGDITYTAIPLTFALLPKILAKKAWVYVCGGWTNISLYSKLFDHYFRQIPRLIVWDKGQMTMRHNGYHSSYELIFVAYTPGAGDTWYGPRDGEGATDVWRVSRPSNAERQHLTEKPVELPARALRNSCPVGGIVWEPFAGSGSTFVAGEKQGLVVIGCELSPAYAAVTLERLAGLGLSPELVD